MARHFGPQHVKDGYAAMGGNLKRPIYSAHRKDKGTIKQSMEREAAKFQRMRKAGLA